MLRMGSVKRCPHPIESHSHSRPLPLTDLAAVMPEQGLDVLPRDVRADGVGEDCP